ncbi:MAG: 5'-3' exonuclease [Candidatus Nanopelagicaceae bacterium]|nr:5'-3' exonuclease [Candidatus Nanopelagicaceae bacterium]
MTLLLLDSASLWYRAFYGLPQSMVSPSGQPVNAIRGYLDSVARMAITYQPDRIVACLDGDWRPSWRTELIPEYKANRAEEESEDGSMSEAAEELEILEAQVPVIMEVLDLIGIPLIGIDDYEADDVIATLSVREPGPTFIVTGDRDLFQLVDDKRKIKVAYIAKGISQHELVDLKWIKNKYEIPGDRYALFATFRGDPSDGLPGARGIGPKGAAIIANNFASIEEVITAAQDSNPILSGALQKKIVESTNYLRRAEVVVNCVANLRLPKGPFVLPKKAPNSKALEILAKNHGIESSVKRLLSALEL